MADFIVGDTKSKIQRQIIDITTKNPLNLTDAKVVLTYRINGGGLQTRTMSIVSPAINGVVEYQWVPGDLEAGVMELDIQITIGGLVLTILDPIKYAVRATLN